MEGRRRRDEGREEKEGAKGSRDGRRNGGGYGGRDVGKEEEIKGKRER